MRLPRAAKGPLIQSPWATESVKGVNCGMPPFERLRTTNIPRRRQTVSFPTGHPQKHRCSSESFDVGASTVALACPPE